MKPTEVKNCLDTITIIVRLFTIFEKNITPIKDEFEKYSGDLYNQF